MREPRHLTRQLPDEAATRALGAELAGALAHVAPAHVFITLEGDLGAGKTTFARGVLAALGVTGAVRSPTYTLLETYAVGDRPVHHLDWYRLAGADDLDGLGFRDLQAPPHWVLVEWPERVPEVAAAADLNVHLRHGVGGPASGRSAEVRARTPAGAALLAALAKDSALG